MFQTVLSEHFANRRRHHKVLNREYAIQDASSGNILSDDEPWKLSAYAGQILNMSMEFNWKEPSLEPRSNCSRPSDTFTSVNIRCTDPKCKLWYQRLAAFEEDCLPFQTIAHHLEDSQKLDDTRCHIQYYTDSIVSTSTYKSRHRA
ncbi:hypothetical protein BDZ45DRAFT_57761 [Acephala macrosclerotiorum]|nr:hypothetical protein BDZ45DRAFT_57761 [Acephala macrosclerotiorum]